MTSIAEFAQAHPVAQAVLVLALVAVAGLALGSLHVRRVGLGIAGVLFAGIAFGHFGFRIDHTILEFVREFGLVLFVYTIGIQVGPGFLTSLRRQGLPLNVMAAAIILLGAGIALIVGRVAGIPTAAIAGIFSGATTNTPSLGAALEALKSVPGVTPAEAALPSLAYAAAYPFGIVGIISAMLFFRWIFRIDPKQEADDLRAEQHLGEARPERMNIAIENENLEGLPLEDIPGLHELQVVVTRVRHAGETEPRAARPETVVHVGDVILAVGTPKNLNRFRMIAGKAATADLMKESGQIGYRSVVVTRDDVLGKALHQLGLEKRYGVVVSRVTRADMEIAAVPDLRLQFGDRVRVVGEKTGIAEAAAALGDSLKALDHTNFIPVFIGIALGVLLGSLPIYLPGMPAPVALGLAGGPLLAAIILSRIGRIGPLVWYMPVNANIAIRELGIVLFLACVGLKAGERFVEILLHGNGLLWMGCAALVTLLPLLLVGFVARAIFRQNFMNICGLLAGSMTDPPALAFANTVGNSDAPAVAYASVYPLTMLLRILAAQMIVLLFR